MTDAEKVNVLLGVALALVVQSIYLGWRMERAERRLRLLQPAMSEIRVFCIKEAITAPDQVTHGLCTRVARALDAALVASGARPASPRRRASDG